MDEMLLKVSERRHSCFAAMLLMQLPSLCWCQPMQPFVPQLFCEHQGLRSDSE